MKRFVAILFVALIAVFVGLTHQFNQTGIEDALARAARAGIENDTRFKRVRIKTAKLDVIVTGSVASDQEKNDVIRLVKEGLPAGNPRFDLKIGEPETMRLQARLDRGLLKLEGSYLPGPELIDELDLRVQGQNFHILRQGIEYSAAVAPPIGFAEFFAQFFKDATSAELIMDEQDWSLRRDIERIEEKESLIESAHSVRPDTVTLHESVRVMTPYLLSGLVVRRSKNGAWLLFGRLPNHELLNKVRKVLPGLVVADKVEIDRLAVPGSWMKELPGFLQTFSVSGTKQHITIGNGLVELHGELTNRRVHRYIETLAAESFSDLTVDSLLEFDPGIASDHDEFTLAVSPEMIVLEGVFQGDASRDQILSAATSFMPEAELETDETYLDQRIPETSWLANLPSILSELEAKILGETLRIELDDRELKLKGKAKSQIAKDIATARVQRLIDEDVSLNNMLVVQENDGGAEVHPVFTVYFASNSKLVRPTEIDRLTKVGVAAETAGEQGLVLIQGVIDSVGRHAYNLALSNERAENVRSALVDLGVPEESIEIIGSRDADPEYKSSQNRRVDITVVE